MKKPRMTALAIALVLGVVWGATAVTPTVSYRQNVVSAQNATDTPEPDNWITEEATPDNATPETW